MRIAILTHKVDFQDGQGRVNYEIARAALGKGHHVTVVAEFCSKHIADHPRGSFVCTRKHAIPTQLLRNLHFAWRSARWLKRHRNEFDVIQANGFVTWEPAHIVAIHFVHTAWLKSSLFPFTWSSFSPYGYYQRILTTMNSYFERKAFHAASALVAVSGFTKSEVVGLGIPPEKVTVVYNGVDIEEFHPGPGNREGFGLPKDVPLALFVGDIRLKRKNLEAILKAMQLSTEMHLVVAGKVEGSPYPAIAIELQVQDRVHFIGKTSQIPLLMRSVDLFVFPSRYEAHPLVLMEAMASGLPVVVSANFGAGDYIGGGGYLFHDPDDACELASLIEKLLRSPDQRRIMGEAARKQALAHQWSRTSEGYISVYDALLAKANTAPGHFPRL